DQLGDAFEQKLADLYPQPKPPAADKSDKDKDKDKDKGDKPPVRNSSFGRGKGTVFLVDIKSRAVIWSLYQKPGRSTPEDLNRTAVHIVERIKKEQKTK